MAQRSQMSDEHRAVQRYLEALDSGRSARGRLRTPVAITARLHRIDEELALADDKGRLALVEERLQLLDQLSAQTDPDLMAQLEEDFIRVARSYGERKGISWAAWREAGVPARVLAAAGIPRR